MYVMKGGEEREILFIFSAYIDARKKREVTGVISIYTYVNNNLKKPCLKDLK